MSVIVLTSNSDIKKKSILKLLANKFKKFEIMYCPMMGNILPPQPYNCGIKCAKERINFAKFQYQQYNPSINYYISVENCIQEIDGKYYDICYVVIESNGFISEGQSNSNILIEDKIMEEMKQGIFLSNDKNQIYGYVKSVGELYYEKNKNILSDNWMRDIAGIDRSVMIDEALNDAWNKLHNLC